MAPELCAQVVRAELGGNPEQVFAAWDPVPLAAASIGQVHRATTRTGLDVAGRDQDIRHGDPRRLQPRQHEVHVDVQRRVIDNDGLRLTGHRLAHQPAERAD